MKLSREDLDEKLDALAAAMPKIMASTSEESQMDAFAGLADDIREAAGLEDAHHVWSRLQCIQRDAGLIPGDDEPCNDGEPKPDDDAVSQ